MEKQKDLEALPRIAIYLDAETQKAVLNEFRVLAQHAIAEATRNVTVNNRYLNQKELCSFMGIGVNTIREWETQGLRYFMKGKKEKIFDLKDVHAFIDEHKI